MGYSRDFIKGIGWIGGVRFLSKAILFAKVFISYRYLSPREVGLFGLAVLALGLLEMLTETGINIIIVRDSRPLSYYINTAYLVAVIRGVLISGVILLLSFILPAFFRDQGLFGLLLLVSVIPVIRGFINPSIIRFQKDLQYHKEALLRLSLLLIDSVAAIVLVSRFHTAQSLIWGMILAALCEVLFSFVFIRPWPKFEFNKKVFHEIVNPGKWMNFAGILAYAEQNFDNVIVGRVLGPTSLGYYQTAFNLTRATVAEIGTAFAQVLLPIYSRISGDSKRLQKAVLSTIIPAALLMLIPVIVLNIPQFQDFIIFYLKEKWRPMLPLVFYLSISAWFTGMNGLINPLFLVRNQLKSLVSMYAIGLVLMLVSVWALSHRLGLLGAAQGVLLAKILLQPVVLYLAVTRNAKKS